VLGIDASPTIVFPLTRWLYLLFCIASAILYCMFFFEASRTSLSISLCLTTTESIIVDEGKPRLSILEELAPAKVGDKAVSLFDLSVENCRVSFV
jgi:hypothetical protein